MGTRFISTLRLSMIAHALRWTVCFKHLRLVDYFYSSVGGVQVRTQRAAFGSRFHNSFSILNFRIHFAYHVYLCTYTLYFWLNIYKVFITCCLKVPVHTILKLFSQKFYYLSTENLTLKYVGIFHKKKDISRDLSLKISV